MVKDRVVELDNGTNYYILEEIEYNDKKYVIACICDIKNNYVNEEDYVVMEIKIENDELVTKNINDEEIANIVTKKLLEKIRKN